MDLPVTPSRHRAPRWKRRKEARPSEILAAALAVFVERGFAATRLEDVATRAGISKGTMYLYFENKEELFKAVVRTSIVPELARAERIAAEHLGSMKELMRLLARGWWDVIVASPLSGIPKLMMAEAVNFPELARFYYEEVVQRGHRVISDVLRRGIEAGEFRPLDIPLATRLAIAPVLFAGMVKNSYQRCCDLPALPDSYPDAHMDIFLRGIANDHANGAARA